MDKPVNADQFKLGMRGLAHAVNIITAAHGGHRYGMTATAVCSVTAEPPTVLVCLNRKSATHNGVSKSKAFCVNVLRAEDSDLSNLFSGAQSGESRFTSRDWSKLATGSPVLVESLVSFDCHVVKKLAHGSHTIFLGLVQQVLFGKKGKALLYAESQYAKLASLAH
ncbi:MAG: flavin reductase, partial [Betaproteobacteria bacterium]|nr:flavin reductase [Betaproteobacteria bacterium]